MAEMTLVHGEEGMHSRPEGQGESSGSACTEQDTSGENIAGMGHDSAGTGVDSAAARPAGVAIDWAAKLAEHDRWLRTIVLARLGERQAVDEVMQEVAVAQRAPLSDLARVGAWLYRLAVRQALLYRRRHGRQRKLVGAFVASQASERAASHSPDPLDLLLRDERRALVREALQRLPRRDREILLLKYTEDWSYRELAMHLGVSESAVEARLHRARQRLRQAMSDRNPEDED
jgi:RNA polymerase sigma factor (sigma-70 family)